MNLGLKLWSGNTDFYIDQAKKLYGEGYFDYIELYVVPQTVDTIIKWEKLKNESGIPFTLHAPHFVHGVNLSDSSKLKFNIEIYNEVNEFFNRLGAQYVVVHSGMEGNIKETLRQLNIIKPKNMLIENKPYTSPLEKDIKCRGAVIEEIIMVLNNYECGFCLDVGHAICTANSLKVEPYDFLAEFNRLNPTCYHFSDNFVDSERDSHLHFGKGNYDFKKILEIIDMSKNVAIETRKDSQENLDDFVADVKWLNSLQQSIVI